MYTNLSTAILIEHSLKGIKGLGMEPVELTKDGAIVVKTGTFTGRAAQDKYVVESPQTATNVCWGKDTKKLDKNVYTQIKMDVLGYLEGFEQIYKNIQQVGAHKDFQLDIELLTPSPTHSLFAKYLFRDKDTSVLGTLGRFTIYHAPSLQLNAQKYNLRSETAIITNMEERTILIVGTFYAGEIKKSIFSVMNYLLPDHGILPMHAGASVLTSDNGKEVVSVFFGLSGTGKTTLSTDLGVKLIGDDEHGLTDKYLFNFEGGCYAKTLGLTKETEPEIFGALTRFGALLENVVLDPVDRTPLFKTKGTTENGRGSYPLSFIEERVECAYSKTPDHLFFLSADAFGVLPPVSLLSPKQAMYYFLSGYTAKVAGTEVGVTTPTAAFSMCFGAPFMLRHPQVYGELLGKYLEKSNTPVWLINTGWSKGPVGVGSRFSLSITREIIRSIQQGKLTTNPDNFITDEFFGFKIPKAIPGNKTISSEILNPINTWENKEEYKKAAKNLTQLFHQNFKKFENLPAEIAQGGPF